MNRSYEKWQEVGPSDALINMFRAYSTDSTEAVQSNVNQLLSRLMESSRGTTTNEENFVQAEKCCFESKVWFYNILESLLREKDRKPRLKKYISSFLEDTPFQRSLVLCCLEITFRTNKIAYYFNPRLLHIFNLAAYNLYEVVDLVLHVRVDLTLDVTHHLLKVVEMTVERLAWTSDSPLWEEIRANEGKLPTCQQVMSPKELEDPMRMEQLDQDSIQAEQTSDQQNRTLNRLQRNIRLYIFARKVYRLMHKRLRTLCSALNLQDEKRLKIWTCFEYSLVHHFDLLRDRHLEWLLLCAIHGVTKNTKDELPFKHIIHCYKNKHVNKNTPIQKVHPEQSQNNITRGRFPTPNTPSVVRDQEYDSITCFYSQVYTPAMGHFVRKLAPTSGVETPPLSPYPIQPSPSNRKYRVSNNLNVFVSQLNKQTSSPQPAGMCYDFQSSPSQCLRDINAMVKLHGPPVKRGRLQLDYSRLQDEDDMDGVSGPSANMAPMSSLQRRILEVERDRMQIENDKVEPSSDL
ncbi:retinoblastoma-like protein 2 [Periophthalmus magnuspinnatus]|uniref:retinoblastoma-like protein 2 n=1 Tax=Periophthalmus magnuspinnatus TaxID=409849 RepID=UPI0024365E2F|nr:retinoblastoma-like protein 2 [Periophthalmus magnuspinnatus]